MPLRPTRAVLLSMRSVLHRRCRVLLASGFGPAADLNIHLYCPVLDGVYERSEAEPVFIEAPASTDEDVHAALHRIFGRLLRMLTRPRHPCRGAGWVADQPGATAQLVFDIDMEHCANRGGELEVIAAILKAPVIERIHEHRGLPARAPPQVPARASMSQAA